MTLKEDWIDVPAGRDPVPGLSQMRAADFNGYAHRINQSYLFPAGGIPAEDLDALSEMAITKALNALKVVNVRDYGAMGDGVSDDSAALKAAQAAMTSNATLYFPVGSYRFRTVNPADGGAIVLSGLSNIGVIMDPGARLLMDNLDGSGLGGGDGILIRGACKNVLIVNTTVEWKVDPADRSNGYGLRMMGWNADTPPTGGWTQSTGTVQYVQVVNHTTIQAPQGGSIFLGCSDVKVANIFAINTHADGLHFNGCRRVTATNITSRGVGDDGLAFVTYYHPTDHWTDGSGFNSATIDSEWNNTDSTATGISVSGNRANGIRIQQGRNVTVSGFAIRDKELGCSINSAKLGAGQDFTSLASRNSVIMNGTIEQISQTGLILAAYGGIDATDDPMWWDFDGCGYEDITITACKNWSASVELTDSSTSKISGVHYENIHATARTSDFAGQDPTLGGKGGMLFSGLQKSTIDGVKLVTDYAGTDISIQGAPQFRTERPHTDPVSGITTTQNPGVTPEALPHSNLTIDNLIISGPGLILVQDIAGLNIGTIESHYADLEGVVFNRVKDTSVNKVKAHRPGRGTVRGRGLQVAQSVNLDVNEVRVEMDSHLPTLFQAVELGSGTALYPGGKGVRIDKVIYTSTLNSTDSTVTIQGGDYGPIESYIRTFWRHTGVPTPIWSSTTYGILDPMYLPAAWEHPTWVDPGALSPPQTSIDFNTLTTAGRYFVVGPNPGWLFSGDTDAHQPPGAPGLLYLEVVTTQRDGVALIFQFYTPLYQDTSIGLQGRGWRTKYGTDDWQPWNTAATQTVAAGSVTLVKLSSAVQASLARADSALQSIGTGVVVSSMIADGTIVLADLATSIQASLAKADSALQAMGNAPTATKLATARNINGTSFDGSADITLPAIPGHVDSIDTIAQDTDFNTMTTPGVYFIGGSFLNGDPTTYNQPGNTGAIKLVVTTFQNGGDTVVFQTYISMDGANKGGQRRRYGGTWNGWMSYSAISIASGSITSDMIADGTITSADLSTATAALLTLAGTAVQFDASGNIAADAFITGFDTTTSSAGTTTLTATSKGQQYLTGTTTHTHVMPTTGIVQGEAFRFTNKSTGSWQVNASGGSSLVSLGLNETVIATANQAVPTLPAHWDLSWQPTVRHTSTGNTAGTLAARDGNANLNADSFVPGVDITVAAAGTTVMTVDSKMTQRVTGTVTQTMQLPTTNVPDGMAFLFDNKSTASITVYASGGAQLGTLQAGTYMIVRANQAAPTLPAHWNLEVLPYNTGNAGSTIVQRNSSAQINAVGFIQGTTSVATAGGTTAFGNSSAQTVIFTGTQTQTATLPSVSVVAGQCFTIINQSTGLITVNSYGTNFVAYVPAGCCASFEAVVAAPTAAADWGVIGYSAVVGINGSTIPLRDSGGNVYARSFISGTLSTATAAGTTALTSSSASMQIWTGTQNQTITLPSVATAGWPFTFVNNSTGVLTINASGGGLVGTVPAGGTLWVQSNSASPTTAAGWTVIGRTNPPKILEVTNSSTSAAVSASAQPVPAGAVGVKVTLIPGGSGGGSGRRGAAGSSRCGGGGGACQPMLRDLYLPVPSGTTTYSYSLGKVGVGGAAVTVNDTDGNPGVAMDPCTFTMGTALAATSSTSLTAGQAGIGSTAGGYGGNPVIRDTTATPVGYFVSGGNGSVGAAGGDGMDGWLPDHPSGAGGGGGISAADVAQNGGNGGRCRYYSSAVLSAGGVVDTTVPPAPASGPAGSGLPGQGGGGGAASKTAAAQAGADGVGYGAPGGGGGASLNGFNSGRGGNGGPAYLRLEWVYA